MLDAADSMFCQNMILPTTKTNKQQTAVKKSYSLETVELTDETIERLTSS